MPYIDKIRLPIDTFDNWTLTSKQNNMLSHIRRLFKDDKFKKINLYNKYLGKNGCFDLCSCSANNIYVSFPQYISDVVTGLLAGKEPIINVINDKDSHAEFAKEIDLIKNFNDEKLKHYEMMKDYIITSAGYQILSFKDGGTIEYNRIPPWQCIGIYSDDIKSELIAVYYEYETHNYSNNTVVIKSHIYTKKNIIRMAYTSDVPTIIDTKPHLLNDVPVIVVEQPDGLGYFEPILSLNSAYNQLLQNMANTHEFNDKHTKLKIKNHQPPEHQTVEEFVRNIDKAGAFFVGDNGDVEYLTKHIEDGAIVNYKNELVNIIQMLTGIPNMLDESFASNSSGVALSYKMYAHEQKATNIDRIFTSAYKRKWSIITDYLNTTTKFTDTNKYDATDISISFVRNMPTNTKELIENAIKLYPYIPKKIFYELLPYDYSPDEMVELLDAQEEKEYNGAFDRFNNNKNIYTYKEIDDSEEDEKDE